MNSGDIWSHWGYDVIHEDIDFYKEDRGDIVISNPPFSGAEKVLDRLINVLDKPFILLMPADRLNRQWFIKNYINNPHLMFLAPSKRPAFCKVVDGNIVNFKRGQQTSGFSCYFYCYKMADKLQMNIPIDKNLLFLPYKTIDDEVQDDMDENEKGIMQSFKTDKEGVAETKAVDDADELELIAKTEGIDLTNAFEIKLAMELSLYEQTRERLVKEFAEAEQMANDRFDVPVGDVELADDFDDDESTSEQLFVQLVDKKLQGQINCDDIGMFPDEMHSMLHEHKPLREQILQGVVSDHTSDALLLMKLSKSQLRFICRKKQMKIGGNKADLITRLLGA